MRVGEAQEDKPGNLLECESLKGFGVTGVEEVQEEPTSCKQCVGGGEMLSLAEEASTVFSVGFVIDMLNVCRDIAFLGYFVHSK